MTSGSAGSGAPDSRSHERVQGSRVGMIAQQLKQLDSFIDGSAGYNPLEMLGIDTLSNAEAAALTWNEISTRSKRIMRDWHPDVWKRRNPNATTAEQDAATLRITRIMNAFEAVQAAFNTASWPTLCQMYLQCNRQAGLNRSPVYDPPKAGATPTFRPQGKAANRPSKPPREPPKPAGTWWKPDYPAREKPKPAFISKQMPPYKASPIYYKRKDPKPSRPAETPNTGGASSSGSQAPPAKPPPSKARSEPPAYKQPPPLPKDVPMGSAGPGVVPGKNYDASEEQQRQAAAAAAAAAEAAAEAARKADAEAEEIRQIREATAKAEEYIRKYREGEAARKAAREAKRIRGEQKLKRALELAKQMSDIGQQVRPSGWPEPKASVPDQEPSPQPAPEYVTTLTNTLHKYTRAGRAEAKPEEAKPDEAKPDEAKPDEAQSSEPQAEESTPVEVQQPAPDQPAPDEPAPDPPAPEPPAPEPPAPEPPAPEPSAPEPPAPDPPSPDPPAPVATTVPVPDDPPTPASTPVSFAPDDDALPKSPSAVDVPKPKFIMPGEMLMRAAMRDATAQRARPGSMMTKGGRILAKEQSRILSIRVPVARVPKGSPAERELARQQIRFDLALQRAAAQFDRDFRKVQADQAKAKSAGVPYTGRGIREIKKEAKMRFRAIMDRDRQTALIRRDKMANPQYVPDDDDDEEATEAAWKRYEKEGKEWKAPPKAARRKRKYSLAEVRRHHKKWREAKKRRKITTTTTTTTEGADKPAQPKAAETPTPISPPPTARPVYYPPRPKTYLGGKAPAPPPPLKFVPPAKAVAKRYAPKKVDHSSEPYKRGPAAKDLGSTPRWQKTRAADDDTPQAKVSPKVRSSSPPVRLRSRSPRITLTSRSRSRSRDRSSSRSSMLRRRRSPRHDSEDKDIDKTPPGDAPPGTAPEDHESEKHDKDESVEWSDEGGEEEDAVSETPPPADPLRSPRVVPTDDEQSAPGAPDSDDGTLTPLSLIPSEDAREIANAALRVARAQRQRRHILQRFQQLQFYAEPDDDAADAADAADSSGAADAGEPGDGTTSHTEEVRNLNSYHQSETYITGQRERAGRPRPPWRRRPTGKGKGKKGKKKK